MQHMQRPNETQNPNKKSQVLRYQNRHLMNYTKTIYKKPFGVVHRNVLYGPKLQKKKSIKAQKTVYMLFRHHCAVHS